jgi:hypothetical protein
MAHGKDVILSSGVFAASRRMAAGWMASWFETAQARLFTMRGAIPRMAGNSKFTLAECPEHR